MNLNQVTVPSTDIARSVAFYKVLGLQQIVASPHYARFVCAGNQATFSIEFAEEDPGQRTAVIYFECTDLDDEVARLREKGVVFDSGPADMSWLWREARLRDPDGNRLCLYFAGENRLNPPWRIKAG